MNRPARIAVTTVFVITTLAAGRAITEALPTDSTLKGGVEPIVVQGKIGKQADLRYAKITVLGIRPALGVEGISNLESTPAHLVVVDLEVVAKDVPTGLSGNLFDKHGRRYSMDKRWLSGTIPTGVPWYVTAVFEVPEDAIEGATVSLAKSDDWWHQRRDHVLEVDLGLDASEAKEFAASRDIIERPDNGLVRVSAAAIGQVPDE